MKTIFKIALLLLAATVMAQTASTNGKSVYPKQQSEKVYAQLNNVLYLPGETVFYKLYITNANNSPTTQSDYVYVEVYDASGKKVDNQCYAVEQGGAAGSFTLKPDMPGGMYNIKCYTRLQEQLEEAAFEKHFYVQKVSANRMLMTLDFRKKGYGPGDLCEADFTLKSNDNQPLRNHKFEYEVFVQGNNIQTLTGTTDAEGKAVIQFKLPQDLTANDGILNVKAEYDSVKESVTRAIPISLYFADLQFLPESGVYVVNQPSNVFFIAKDEFGKPLDVSGYIEDNEGNKVQDFVSFYDGMGKVAFTPQPGKSYFALITAPFKGKQKYALPTLAENGYSFTLQQDSKSVQLSVYAPVAKACEILVRNQDKIYSTIPLNATAGLNSLTIPTEDLPIGTYAVSLVAGGRIAAERLVFVNYTDGLSIDISTDKPQYLPREKVQASIITKDKDNNPVASSLSVSVVDEKVLSYIDDKQHNLLTWMFFGHELKGTVHEPRFYFDEKETLEKRTRALDLLLNTHGWRRYSQDNLNMPDGSTQPVMAEKASDVEGFIEDKNGAPAVLKVYLITDSGEVYETYSNSKGYFKFTRAHFTSFAWVVAESNRNRQYTITNSITNLYDVNRRKESLNISGVGYNSIAPLSKPAGTAQAPQLVQQQTGSVSLVGQANNLDEVVVVGYGTARSNVSGAISTIVAREDVVQNLTGMVAGVQVQTATGQPGSMGSIRIRGAGSFNGNTDPLVVVDGVPVPMRDYFSSLNPNDIYHISVLKDSRATAIYGTRGANGVILITTKKGSYGNGITLSKTNHYTYQGLSKGNGKTLTRPAQFYAPVYKTTETEEKNDFRNCIYWNATVQTNADGKATFEFYNSDDTSTFSIVAEGTSYKGNLGLKKHSYVVKEPVQTDVKLPLYATQEDVIKIPLWIKNNSGVSLTVNASLEKSGYFECTKNVQAIKLDANEAQTVYFNIKALKQGSKVPLRVQVSADGATVTINREMDIYSKGFPVSLSFAGTKNFNGSFVMEKALENSIQAEIKFIVNPYNELSNGLDAMMREPSGCFEQVSSSNYPNIMAMQLLSAKGGMDEAFRKKVIGYLESGYKKLTNYRSSGGGYEWYGGNPGHEVLTAYGLLQFYEMKAFIKTDPEVEQDAIEWLYSRKDGNGGFKQKQGKYGFSGTKEEVANAYIVYVLSEIGAKNFNPEYNKALAEALQSRDVYRSALVALAAYNIKDMASYKTLIVNIKSDIEGKDYGKVAVGSTVTRSYEKSATVEWLSLYALAIMKEKKIDKDVLDALDYIQSCKTHYGFGSTQATALGLKAITTFSMIGEYATNRPNVTAMVNNKPVAANFDKGGNITADVAAGIVEGNNTFSIAVEGERMVPSLLYVNYQSYLPHNSPDCALELKTRLTNTKVKVSETTRIAATLTNKYNTAFTNPLVRIGLPGGTSPEPWQLKELVDKGVVDYYEIFGSELVLYFREIGPNETRNINIDLKAIIPGQYVGIASSAYLYYNNRHKNWNEGLKVEVTE